MNTTTSLIESAAGPRTAEVVRNTAETKIAVRVNLDGTGKAKLSTGIGFFDHMLDQIARHGLIDLDIDCQGDLHIDGHHTVEDVGITLGQAVYKAIGDKKGIRRYGHAYVPLDEALSRVVIDFSGRPGLDMHVPGQGRCHPRLGEAGCHACAQFRHAGGVLARPVPSA